MRAKHFINKKTNLVKEGWGSGSDRVHLPDEPSTYWAGNGQLQKEYDALYNELVPSSGKADTIEGEVLRASSKIVYRHYNDGDEFNQASFDQLEPYIGTVTSYDDLAHKAIEFALKANGNYTPNPNWDSLDVMEYGPEEDDYDDEEDEEEDYGWDEEEDEEVNEEYDEEDDYEEEEDEGFFVAISDEEDGVFIGMVVKEDGKWRERRYKGNAPHNWGGTYMGYLTPEDVMSWINKDYGRNYEVQGPMSEDEANEYMDYMSEGRGDSKGLHKKVKIVKGPDAGKTGYVRQIKTDRIKNRVYLDLDLEDGGQSVVLKQDVRLVKEVDEARTTWNNDFYVYDPKTKAVKKKFRTHKGAKQYAEANGLKVASAEYYHDSVSKEVDEGMEEFAKAQAAKRAAARKEKSQTKEGWESGPEERGSSRERDPDDAYDDMRQQRADAEADKAQAQRPQEKYYTLSGRGPNYEPNYAFPGEYDSLDAAVAARTKLMADPSTPNPRDIGISTRTRYLDLKEGIDSTDPVEGAVLAAVQELIQQGHTEVAPEVITNMVVAATSQPFLLKDLVDCNNNSAAVQHYIDSINPTKVKFSNEILTVKNEDPLKDKQQSQDGVSKMASRAASRNRSLAENDELGRIRNLAGLK